MKRLTLIAASFLAFGALALQTAEAQRAERGARANRAGGFTAAQIHDRQGPNGGTVRGARGVISDGQGNGVAGSTNCATGAAGKACRAGATTRTADGAVSHESRFKAEGSNGSQVTSQGGFSKTTEGAVTGGRSTDASGQNGSISVDSAYNSETGRSRTVSCMNTAGETVACPSH